MFPFYIDYESSASQLNKNVKLQLFSLLSCSDSIFVLFCRKTTVSVKTGAKTAQILLTVYITDVLWEIRSLICSNCTQPNTILDSISTQTELESILKLGPCLMLTVCAQKKDLCSFGNHRSTYED